MLRIMISYRQREAAKALAFNADELHTRLMQELDKAKIFVVPDSAAAGTKQAAAAAAAAATTTALEPAKEEKPSNAVPVTADPKKKK
jgi:hypothetical protein